MLTGILNRSLRGMAPAAALVIVAGQAIADPDIARLAPENAFVVVSVPNWAQLRSAVDASGLGRLMKDPAIESFLEKSMKEGSKDFKELLDKVQIDFEDLKHPTGHVGAALFWPTPANGEVDPEEDEPHMLFVADFGEHADDWQKIIDNLVDRGLDDRMITLDDDTYRDVKITIIAPVYDEEHHGPDRHEHDHDHGFDLAEWLGGSFEEQRSLHLARTGGTFIFSSSLEAIESAIDRMNGGGREALAESAIYRDALAQHDRGTLAHIVFLTSPIFNHLDDDNSFGPSPKLIMDVLGFTPVKAISASLRMGTADAIVDINLSALTSEKKGFLSLLDEPAGAFDPPSFAGPDAAGVSRIAFRFDRLLDVMRGFAQSLPEDERAQVTALLEQGSAIAGPALEAMGPVIHSVNSYRLPYSADSAQSTVAIDVKDEMTINNTLSFLASQAGGMLETRDFEGTVMYSMEFPAELSIAVGLGRLFIGSTTGVENALRAAGRPDAPRLAEERRFREATRPLSNNAVAYFYLDLPQYLRWMWWSFENADKIMEEQLDRMGFDDEYREEMLRWHRENQAEWQKDLPPVDAITRHVGDMVYELRSTPDGFTSRLLLLEAREENR